MRPRARALLLVLALPLAAGDEPTVESATQLAIEGDLDGALAALDRVIAAHPQDPRVHQQRALVHYALGEFEPGLTDASKALDLDPGLIAAVRTRGAILLRSSRPKEAVAAFDRCTELNQGDGCALIGRTACHAALGDMDAAVADYRAALGHAEQAEGFRRLLAARLGQPFPRKPDGDAELLLAGAPDAVWPVPPRPDEARDVAAAREKKAHEAGEKSEEARAAVLLGRALEHPLALAKLKKEEQRARIGDARGAYLRAIKADGRNPAGYVAWAESFLAAHRLMQQGRDPWDGALNYLSEAHDLLESALQGCGDSADLHRLLGTVLEAEGNIDAAIEHYEKAIALSPNDPRAYGSLAGLHLRRRNDTDKAIEALQRCVKACPDDAESKLALAFVFLRAGRKEDALAATREAFPRLVLTRPIGRDSDLAQLLQGVGLLPR